MRSRSSSRRSGRRRSGSAPRRIRLRARWITRPTHASGPSVAIRIVPTTDSTTATTMPTIAISSRSRLTPPRMNAGIASTGIASTTPNVSRLTAVSADATDAEGTPDWTSMRNCSAAPMAPPPGAILLMALPASCDRTTGDQRLTCSASRWSTHRQASAQACSTAIASSHHGDRSLSSPQEPNVSIRLGATR